MGNRTVSKLRRNMLLKGGLDRAYGKRAVQKIVFRVFLYTLIFGLSFTMLYPLIKVLPAVFGDFATLDDPNVVWIPRKLSVLSFTAAIRIGFGNGTAVLLSLREKSLLTVALSACAAVFVVERILALAAGQPLFS